MPATPALPKAPDKPTPEKPADKIIEAGSPAAEFLRELVEGSPRKPEKPPEQVKPEGDKPPVEKVKKKPAPVAQPAAPAIDEEKLGAAVGRAIAANTPKPEPEKRESGKPVVDRRLEVLRHMETMKPETKGVVERYQESKAKLEEYKSQWAKDNPDKEFNPDDEEHADFVDELESEIGYDEDDYTEALADIRAEQKFTEKSKTLESKLTKIERAEKLREEAPKLAAVAETTGNAFWKDMGEGFEHVVKDGQLDVKALSELKASDPVAHDIVVGAAQSVEIAAQVITKLANGLEEYDDKNDTHRALANFAVTQEQKLMQRPREKRLDEEGREFLPKAQYLALPESQRRHHWTFGADDLIYMARVSVGKQAKERLAAEEQKFIARAKSRKLIQDEKPQPRPPVGAINRRQLPGVDKFQAAPPEPEEIERSPSFTPSPKVAARGNGSAAGGKTGMEKFMADFIGG